MPRALLIPNYMTITLLRCIISFTIPTKITNNVNSSINFLYNLSPNCYRRIGTNFSLNIIASPVNISKTLICEMMENNKTTCIVCDNKTSHCFHCSQNHFTIRHDVNDLDDCRFIVDFRSNMIDLKVFSSNNTIQFYRNKIKNNIFWNTDLLYLLLLLVIPIIMIIYCRKQYMNAFIVDKSLVLIIGICQFDDKRMLLAGVKSNVVALTKLWRDKYKYDVFICNNDTLYVAKQNVI
eukprot:383982_1